MRAPRFWFAAPGPGAWMLAPFGALYGAITARRMAASGTRAGRPVICVGNFTVGGAGKTPVVAAVGRLLSEQGRRPFVVSRGYGGREAGPVRVDPARHTAAEMGDEPIMLAAALPVVVARDRAAGAARAIAEGADVVLLDDGLQNPALAKDLAIAVVDGATGVGNGFCLPAGPLRAPLHRQLPRAGAIVVLGPGQPGEAMLTSAATRSIPAFRAALAPDAATAAHLKGERVLAFAGIGRPEKFARTLAQVGATVVGFEDFPDHYPYNDEELAALATDAKAAGLTVVTTEKDAARIGAAAITRHFGDRLQVLPVQVEFEAPEAFAGLLARAADGQA